MRFLRLAAVAGLITLMLNGAPGRVDAIDKSYDPMHPPPLSLYHIEDYGKSGSGIISGQLTAVTKKFGKLVYPNAKIYLIPANNFTYYYINDMAYGVQFPNNKRFLTGYPIQISKYTRETLSDSEGNFEFSNLPDGDYYLDAYVQYERDSHPEKTRTTFGVGPDGETVYGTERHEGLKIDSDDAVVWASATVDATGGKPHYYIYSFDVMGEFLCCRGSI